MCEEYNGYTNYQTWNVALWLDNEQPTNEMLHQLANSEGPYTWMETDIQKANHLKDYIEGMAEPTIEGAGMFSDLLGHAIANVDWLEIIRTHQE